MSAGYRTAPTGIISICMGPTTGTYFFKLPCKATLIAVSAGTLTHTGGTYAINNAASAVLAARAFPTAGTAEVIRSSALAFRKSDRDTTWNVVVAGTVGSAQVVLFFRPEGQLALNPTDDI